MTEDEALEILKKHNVHRGFFNKGFFDNERLFLRKGDEILKGEQIGEIGAGCIFICDYIPSVIGKSYLFVHATEVRLDRPDAPALLDKLLDQLDTSAERYDEETRRKRVYDIHQYFLKRNMKIKILPSDVDIPDPPDPGTLYLR